MRLSIFLLPNSSNLHFRAHRHQPRVRVNQTPPLRCSNKKCGNSLLLSHTEWLILWRYNQTSTIATLTKMKHLLISAALLALAAACTSPSQRKANHEAEAEARKAAEAVLAIDTVEPVDSFALERAILEAKATQSRYIAAGNQEAADNFHRTFSATISERKPDLAEQLFVHDAEPE